MTVNTEEFTLGDSPHGPWMMLRHETELMAKVWSLVEEEVGAVMKFVPEDRRRVVVQAGGHQGVWPHHLSKLFDTVYTFEPDFLNFAALAHNISHLPNVFPARAALGNAPGPREIFRAKRSGSHQVLHDTPGPTLLIRIDDLYLDELHLLYLDVETSELQIMKGARQTIHRCNPVIVIEATGLDPADGRNEYYADKAGWLERVMGYSEVSRINKNGIWVRK